MSRGRAGRLGANLAAMALGASAALLIGEIAVRLAWRDAPAGPARGDTLPLERVPDGRILYRLVPGSSGHFNGTEIQVNSQGLREREITIARVPGTPRILVLGDSMVFGIGLPAEATLPARLAQALAPAETINAGIFGYNLEQEISLLRDVGLRYRPDVVVSCFVHNDIENWGLGEGGAVPEIRSTRFEPPPRDVWSTRLADLMLPGTFDPERLNLLPRPEQAGLRARLASISRLYLFAYLRLRTHSWNLSAGESREPIVESPACQTDRVVWEPLRERYRRLRRLVEESGARLVVVIQGGLWWEGTPIRRLLAMLKEEGILHLDLTPVWLDREHYAKHYSLGWDPHPNGRADRLAAELIAEFLRLSGMVPGGDGGGPAAAPGPHDVLAAREDLRGRLDAWRARQEELVAAERDRWAARARSFAASIDLGSPGPGVDPEQILYGFWDPQSGPPRGASARGRWMSTTGGVILAHPPGARKLRIAFDAPVGAEASRAAPSVLRVTLGEPAGRCEAAVLELGAGSHEVDLPAALEGARQIEVDLSVDRAFPATYLMPGARDPRLVSFLIERISVE